MLLLGLHPRATARKSLTMDDMDFMDQNRQTKCPSRLREINE
jgi:hypothetical protein